MILHISSHASQYISRALVCTATAEPAVKGSLLPLLLADGDYSKAATESLPHDSLPFFSGRWLKLRL